MQRLTASVAEINFNQRNDPLPDRVDAMEDSLKTVSKQLGDLSLLIQDVLDGRSSSHSRSRRSSRTRPPSVAGSVRNDKPIHMPLAPSYFNPPDMRIQPMMDNPFNDNSGRYVSKSNAHVSGGYGLPYRVPVSAPLHSPFTTGMLRTTSATAGTRPVNASDPPPLSGGTAYRHSSVGAPYAPTMPSRYVPQSAAVGKPPEPHRSEPYVSVKDPNALFKTNLMKENYVFKGEQNAEKLLNYQQRVELALKYSAIPLEIVVDFLTAKFEGTAASWWRSLTTEFRSSINSWWDQHDGVNLWPGLKTLMTQQFVPLNLVRSQLENFKKLQCGKNVIDFNIKFNHQLNNIPSGIPEFVAQNYYMSALPVELQEKISVNRNILETLNAMQQAAARISVLTKQANKDPTTAAAAFVPRGRGQPPGGRGGGAKGRGRGDVAGDAPICEICGKSHKTSNCYDLIEAKKLHKARIAARDSKKSAAAADAKKVELDKAPLDSVKPVKPPKKATAATAAITASKMEVMCAESLSVRVRNTPVEPDDPDPDSYNDDSQYADYEALIDSGTSDHMADDLDLLEPSTLVPISAEIQLASDATIHSYVKGSVFLYGTKSMPTLELQHVLGVEALRRNLISVSKCNDNGIGVNFHESGKVYFNKQRRLIATGNRRGNLFYLLGRTRRTPPKSLSDIQALVTTRRQAAADKSLPPPAITPLPDPIINPIVLPPPANTPAPSHPRVKTSKPSGTIISPAIAHGRLGHPALDLINRVGKVSTGWPAISADKPFYICEPCSLGKAHRLPFGSGNKRDYALGELVHSDLQGKFRISSVGSGLYICSFIEHKSRHAYIFVLSDKKAETILRCWKVYLPWLERTTQLPNKILRSDGGGEYKGVMNDALISSGIIHQCTVRYTSQQNGISERWNLTLLDRLRSVLIETRMPRNLWGHLAHALTYLYNLTPNSNIPTTPLQVLTGEVVNLSHLRRLGCLVYSQIPLKGHDKMAARA